MGNLTKEGPAYSIQTAFNFTFLQNDPIWLSGFATALGDLLFLSGEA